MYTALIIFIIIIAILLMLVVLAQNPKGGGLSSQFGGSGATQMMGVRKTGDFLEKATWTLAVALMIMTLFANVLIPDTKKGSSGPVTPDLDVNNGSAPPLAEPTTTGNAENELGNDLEDLLAEPNDSSGN